MEGASPFSRVCVGGAGPLGEGRTRGIHLSSPWGWDGGRPGAWSPGVPEGGEASSGHRGKQRAGGGTSCQGPGCPAPQRKRCQGPRGGGRKWAEAEQGRGQRRPRRGGRGPGGGGLSAGPHPVSPESPPPQPAALPATLPGRPHVAPFKVLRIGGELARPPPPPSGASPTPPSAPGLETTPLPSPNTFQGPPLGTHFCLALELISWSPPSAGT